MSSTFEDEKPLKKKTKGGKKGKGPSKQTKKVLSDNQIRREKFLRVVHVTAEKVHEILGLPVGGISLYDLPERREDDEFVQLWLSQFAPKKKKQIFATNIAKKLVRSTRVDFMFKVNILMLFVNVMGKAYTMRAFVNLSVVRCIREDTNIAGVDWCDFIHRCLAISHELNTISGFYDGPLYFLILLYLDSTKFDRFLIIRSRLAIKNWSTKTMSTRQDLEIEDEAFGKLEFYREWNENEIVEAEGFCEYALVLPHTNKKIICEMIEEKLSSISKEKAEVETLLRDTNKEFSNDDNKAPQNVMPKPTVVNTKEAAEKPKPAENVKELAKKPKEPAEKAQKAPQNAQKAPQNVKPKPAAVKTKEAADKLKPAENVKELDEKPKEPAGDDYQVVRVATVMKAKDCEEFEVETFTQWIEGNIDWVREDEFHAWPRVVEPVNMVQPSTPERVFSSPSKEYVKPVKPVNLPYMCRRIDVAARCKRVEFMLGNNLFAMEGDKYETVFQSLGCYRELSSVRVNMETLAPTLWIDANVIYCWVTLLNFKELALGYPIPTRHFFPTRCINQGIIKGTLTEEEQWKSFLDEIKAQFKYEPSSMSLSDFELVFFSIYASDQFYVVVFNIKKQRPWYLKEQNHSSHEVVAKMRPFIPKLKWRTLNNHVDCRSKVEVVREILQLNDAEGVICLPNEEIFAGLARMGYEKRSTKLTFYKALFSPQWKFFIHTILHSLSAKRTSWNEFSSAMAVGKGISWIETPLFESMLIVRDVAEEAEAHVPAQGDNVPEPAAEEVVTDVVPPTPTPPSPPSPVIPSSPPYQPPCPPQPQDAEVPSLLFQQVLDTCSPIARRVEGLEHDKAAQQLEIVKLKARVKKLEKINMVKSSKLRWLKKVGTSQRVKSSDDMKNEKDAEFKGRHADKQAEIYNIDLDHSSKVLSMQEDDTEVQEAVEIVTTAKLMTEVVTAATTQVVAAGTPILAAKTKILNITAAPAVLTRRRKGVVIRDPEEELSSDTPAETPKVKDKGKGILIEAPKPMKKKDQIEMDAEYARKLQEEINKEHEESYKNIDWNAALNHVQSKEPQYIKRYHGMKKKPQTESEARKNMIFYLKNTEGYKMDFFKGMKYNEVLPIFQAKFDANMRFLFKSREEMEEEDKEIIKSINETPAQKAAKRRKLHEQAKEDEDLKKKLEVVDDEDDDVFIKATPIGRKVPVVDYEIVMINNKPRYKIIKADVTYQLYISFITLTMFEKTDGQDAIWRNQHSGYGQALVKIEKRYPLSKFTLEQLVNVVRLKVEEESEMSLELLRFTRQQLQEYQQGVDAAKWKLLLLEQDDEDDDVFIEATPIDRKVPVVDYKIMMINNKPRYKIIKADGTHQLYISFITLLKNFDREDLEDLWRIVKARFSTLKPTNFSDDYLLSTLKTMFEKLDGQDTVWRNQNNVYSKALVKSWKLLTSCGVHIISLTATNFILLVEKRYPLSRFTLEQLVNVARLQVDEDSKMSLELLRFTR
nr:ulp1 protease family, C-terminal catalytic domain-containing protein [Tanacetum cinerariifolium]